VPKLHDSSSRRDLAISAAFLLAACALAALLAVRAPLGVDYSGPLNPPCDCPGASIRALAHGHLHGFFAAQPVMGIVSLVLRAPFAALGIQLGDGSEHTLYRLGAFPCLLAAGLVGIYLFRRMRELGRSPLACLILPVLLAINPLTMRALKFGHPEEILATALCVAAALAATRRRPLLAGVLLGAAIATKQWALLAVLPVAFAERERVWTVILAAAGAAALLMGPMAAGDLHRFLEVNRGAGIAGDGALPTNVWFGFGTDIPIQLGPNGGSMPPRAIPHLIAAMSHPLVVLVGVGLALLWLPRRRHAEPADALLLISLIMLVRCLLDPLTNSYYHLPFLVSLAAWEGLRREGAPLLTVAAALLLGLTVSLARGGMNFVDLNHFYLLWALPFAGLLGALAFRPAAAPASLPEPA
jgi:hypothetical protein